MRECLMTAKRIKGGNQELLHTPYPQIIGVVRQFAPPVTYVTFPLICSLFLIRKKVILEK